MRTFLYFFAFHFLVILTCSAQNDDALQKKLDALKYFEGNWKVKIEARLSAQGPWDTSIARSIMKLTTGSKILEEDLTGTRKGKPILFKMMMAVNNLTGVYQRIFADSEHGALVDFDGAKDQQSFVFDKLWTYPNGSTVKLRAVYTIISNDEFTVESMRMPQGAIAWDITGKMRYRRSR